MRRLTALVVGVFVITMFGLVPVLAQVPGAPTALDPTEITASSFRVNWDSTGFAHDHVTNYRLDVSTVSNFATFFLQNVDATAPWYNVTGVTPFLTYYYRLRAENSFGPSLNSNVVAAPIAVPTVADGATNITSTGFTAHWEAAPGVSGYKLDIATLSSFGPVVHTSVWDSAVGNVTSFTVTGLTPDTTYWYRVRTVSGAGESASSNKVAVSRIISTPSLASGTINVPYTLTLQFDGTATPMTWTVASGSLPTGLSLDASTGTIQGTPTTTGTFHFVVQCVDDTPAPVTKAFTIVIVSTPTIAFDAVKKTYIWDALGVGPTLTWNHNVGAGTNRMLIVHAAAMDHKDRNNFFASSVTYNGKPLTLAGRGSETDPGVSDNNMGLSVWYLLEKDMPTDGLDHPIVATWPGNTAGEAGGSISLFNCKQAAPEAVAGDSAAYLNNGGGGTLTSVVTTHTNHAWLINVCADEVAGGFFLIHDQEFRYQIDNGFDMLGDTKEVLIAGRDSMLSINHLTNAMVQITIAVAPVGPTLVYANAKVFLQGPYVAAGDTMSFNLKKGGYLASHFGSIPIPGLAVDSINIELRDSSSAAKATKRRFAPAWLLTNGTLRAFADTTQTTIPFDSIPAGKYYMVIRHRNHLAIMSAQTDSVDSNPAAVAYDFSTGQAKAWGTNAMKALGTRFAMLAGDANGDGNVNAVDKNIVWRAQNGFSGYLGGDSDLSGTSNAVDANLFWRANNGIPTQVP